MFYELPGNLSNEIEELESLIAKHLRGEADATSLKVRRVPFGCYEQRKLGTYMLRVRATGGAITPEQLLGLARISAKVGAEHLHITTRQEFQIHDVSIENVIPALRALLPLGLTTRGGGGNTVRNILVSPDAGVGVDEIFDPSPWAFALTTRLIAEADSWNLPRKFKIAFSNSPADSAYAQFNDVGFLATIKDGRQGFKVYVAGGLGASSSVGHLLEEFIPAEDAYIVSAALKHLFDKHGNRKNRNAARLRFLWSKLGEDRFRQIYQDEVRQLAQLPLTKLHPLVIDQPLDQAAAPAIPATGVESAEYARWRKRYVFPQRQPGLYSIVVPASLGNIANQHVAALAQYLRAFGPHSIRAAFGQNLRLRNIPEAALAATYQVVRDITNLADAPLALANAVSCTGADTCQLGICLPKPALIAASEKLAGAGLDLDSIPSFQLNLSGCPNSCGQHTYADLGFYGQARHRDKDIYPAYGVVAGGVHADGQARLAEPIGTVAARDLPEFTRQVISLWLSNKHRFASFSEYVKAEGRDEIKLICERFLNVPAFSEEPSYYTDWGADKPFSLVGRGQGECSAGLFDQIGIDLKRIADLRKRLAAAPASDERYELLYQIAFSASRALLVTRGIDAVDEESVFSSFQRHFIGGGLIDSRYYSVVDAARLREFGDADQGQADILALADAVKDLYDSLDSSLRIHA
jgi:sulfite reductase (ferredoxin)